MNEISLKCLRDVIDHAIKQLQLNKWKQKETANIVEMEIPLKTSIAFIEEPITYDSFFSEYLIRNVPCVFGKWATKDWPALEKWTKVIGDQSVPDFSHLKQVCQNATVSVSNCGSKNFNAHECTEWSFLNYVLYFEEFQKNSFALREPCFYLKDWHYFRSYPEDHVYKIPVYFSSDWINELWENGLPPFQDDFRFVYIGPKSSWTPFHADVFRSFSWSANVCGRKKWLLYPPGVECHLKHKTGQLPFDINSDVGLNLKPIEVIQETGQVVFVPSGWYHQVHNMEDTISINHNWFNGCNLYCVWSFFKSELTDVEHEIHDCRDMMSDKEWIEQCQTLMRANTGLNLHDFFAVLKNILKLRESSLALKISDMEKSTFSQKLICAFDDSEKPAIPEGTDVTVEKLLSMFSILSNAINKICESNNSEHETVPYEIIDLCFMIPVLIDMHNYYQLKQLPETPQCHCLLRRCYYILVNYIKVLGECEKLK